jgi:hypothetical protein
MDWDKVRAAPSTPAEPRLDLVETCWQFKSPNSQRVITCAIFQTDAGLETRVSYSTDDIVRTERAIEIGNARELAAEWRQALIDKGFIEITDETHKRD